MFFFLLPLEHIFFVKEKWIQVKILNKWLASEISSKNQNKNRNSFVSRSENLTCAIYFFSVSISFSRAPACCVRHSIHLFSYHLFVWKNKLHGVTPPLHENNFVINYYVTFYRVEERQKKKGDVMSVKCSEKKRLSESVQERVRKCQENRQ